MGFTFASGGRGRSQFWWRHRQRGRRPQQGVPGLHASENLPRAGPTHDDVPCLGRTVAGGIL